MQTHILNGDALKMQFPVIIEGEKIIARECLVDGDVEGDHLEDLFTNRAHFLLHAYGENSDLDYREYVVDEFEKMKLIPQGTDVNLWFEEDLFCQVNFWFVCWLVDEYDLDVMLFWVKPDGKSPYGFGGMDHKQLLEAYDKRYCLSKKERAVLSHCWNLYRAGQSEAIVHEVKMLGERFQSIIPAVEANQDRFPSDGSLGRPEQSLQQIVQELDTYDFGKVFQEFCARESVYGFGDLQVKRIWNRMNLTKGAEM